MTDSCQISVEVCVVGGGPAGSSIARRLALLGHQVCLIERDPFPRTHVGESLPPSILPLLDLLGVRSPIEQAGFLRPTRSRIRWSTTTDGWKLQPGEPGFQVDRGRFDQLLLQAAQAAGVQVLQPVRAQRPQRSGWRQWSISALGDDRHYHVNAQFLVDATGKHSVLLDKPQRSTAFTLALYGYWRDTGLPGAETRVEAGASEWYWGAPLPDGTVNAAVFINAGRCAGLNRRDREGLYRSLLAQSTLLHGCLNGVLQAGPFLCDASCYVRKSTVQEDCIAVGEAAFSIDPLSSQGVQAAIMSAFAGSIVVHTLLTDPDNRETAIAFYQERQQDTIAHHQKIAAQLYAEQDLYPLTPFWQARTRPSVAKAPSLPSSFDRVPFDLAPGDRVPFDLAPGDRVQLSEFAQIVDTPVIQGDRIARMPALRHPALARPVAYLGNVAIAPLLAVVSAGQTSLELIQIWSHTLPPEQSWAILQWLWTQTIIVPWLQPASIPKYSEHFL